MSINKKSVSILLCGCVTDDEVDETSISQAAKLNFETSKTTTVSYDLYLNGNKILIFTLLTG